MPLFKRDKLGFNIETFDPIHIRVRLNALGREKGDLVSWWSEWLFSDQQFDSISPFILPWGDTSLRVFVVLNIVALLIPSCYRTITSKIPIHRGQLFGKTRCGVNLAAHLSLEMTTLVTPSLNRCNSVQDIVRKFGKTLFSVRYFRAARPPSVRCQSELATFGK